MPEENANAFFAIDDTFKLKVGAVVVKRMEGTWYFAYLESLSRPGRAFQVVRGTVERGEDIYNALSREIKEEYGREVKVLSKFAISHHYRDGKLADVQTYFLAEDQESANPAQEWEVEDGDEIAQKLLWRFAPLEGDLSFLSRGHADIVAMARQRLLS